MRIFITLVIAALFARAAHAQSTFTYQGELQENAQPANGTYDLRFEIFDTQTGGVPLDSINESVNITNGLFSVELTTSDTLESERWLEIAVITPDASQIQIISPRQKITEAPRASFALRTRGIFVDNQLRVGIGTETPSAPLEVKQDAVDTDVFRISDIARQFQLRFRAQLRDTLIQAWNAAADAPETLLLNPEGGITRVGPQGLGFFDGTVQTTAALRVVTTLSAIGSATGGTSNIVSLSAPGVLPSDIAVIAGNGLARDVIPHSPSTLTDQVRVVVTNASNDLESSSTSFTIYVLRP